MRVLVLATGKTRKGPLTDLCAEYMKRLKAFWPTQEVELPQVKFGSAEQIKAKEAQAQLEKIPQNATVIALDETGKEFSTRQLAQKLETFQNSGTQTLCFIIGGAEGLDDSIRQRADLTLSLSQLTFPHQLARVVLLEQIYRCATLLAGHPYHRD